MRIAYYMQEFPGIYLNYSGIMGQCLRNLAINNDHFEGYRYLRYKHGELRIAGLRLDG